MSLPLVRAAAPGRVNLIGEHLDYNGGRCLPIAIGRRTRATIDASPDGHVHVRSGDLSWSGAPGERAEGWAGYVVGVLDALGVSDPLRIRVSSDVPVGAGLSSSAALECSVAVAVNAALALGRSDDELITACVRAETSYVGAPTGGLDQAAVLLGRAGQALLLDFADGTRAPVAWRPEPAGLTLLVIDTQVSHQNVAGEYAARRSACERAAAVLGVPHLARATGLDGLEDDLLPRARHVITEQARVEAFVAALAEEDWAAVGALMTASHVSLRDDFEVSCAELDAVVDAALEAGAAGARMTGGGFGGAAIALVPTGRVDAVREAVLADFEKNERATPAIFTVEASAGAEVLQVL